MPEDSKKPPIAGYNGSLKDLADALGDLEYDQMAQFADAFRAKLKKKSVEARTTTKMNLAVALEKAETGLAPIIIALKEAKKLTAMSKKTKS